MKDPNDTRDTGPRVGSPLWTYLTSVTAVGLVALGLTMLHLPDLRVLPGVTMFWLVATLIMIGQIWPIVTPGRSSPESPVASLTFSFAAMLYWGLPVAVLLRMVATIGVGAAQRKAPHRIAFNAAQLTLSTAAAWLALELTGVRATPSRPWDLSGGQLPKVALAAVAYFAVNYVLVGIAVALHARAPIWRTLTASLPYQAFVNLVLLATAPLVTVVMGVGSACWWPCSRSRWRPSTSTRRCRCSASIRPITTS